MAGVSFLPAQADIAVDAQLGIDITKTAIPPHTIRPYRINIFDAPDFRMKNGWPTSVPDYDVRGEVLVSADGVVIDDRPSPYNIQLDPTLRWIADSQSFSVTDLAWYPTESEVGSIAWNSSPTWLPTLIEDYTYTIGAGGTTGEQFTAQLLNFDTDSVEHMWCNIEPLNESFGYTIIMVARFASVYGDDEASGFTGIIGNGSATPAYGRLDDEEDFIEFPWQLRLFNDKLVFRTDNDRLTVGIPDFVHRSPPSYIALAIGRPETTMYVSKGPNAILEKTCFAGERGQPFSGELVLARSLGDTTHTADVGIMEISVYADKLSSHDIRTKISRLASVYGSERST